MLEMQHAVVRLAVAILRANERETPEWLVRPGRTEARRRWPLFQKIYSSLEPGQEKCLTSCGSSSDGRSTPCYSKG